MRCQVELVAAVVLAADHRFDVAAARIDRDERAVRVARSSERRLDGPLRVTLFLGVYRRVDAEPALEHNGLAVLLLQQLLHVCDEVMSLVDAVSRFSGALES